MGTNGGRVGKKVMSWSEMNGIHYAQEKTNKASTESRAVKIEKEKTPEKERKEQKRKDSPEMDLLCSPWLAASRGALSVSLISHLTFCSRNQCYPKTERKK